MSVSARWSLLADLCVRSCPEADASGFGKILFHKSGEWPTHFDVVGHLLSGLLPVLCFLRHYAQEVL